jgi:hypothetical protein
VRVRNRQKSAASRAASARRIAFSRAPSRTAASGRGDDEAEDGWACDVDDEAEGKDEDEEEEEAEDEASAVASSSCASKWRSVQRSARQSAHVLCCAR